MLGSKGEVKVSDMGVSKVLASTDAAAHKQKAGTLKFFPPEAIKGLPINLMADSFSVGGMLFEILAGFNAFKGQDEYETKWNILNRHPPKVRKGYSKFILKALWMMLRKVPDERPSAIELLELFKGVDMQGVDVELVAHQGPSTSTKTMSLETESKCFSF